MQMIPFITRLNNKVEFYNSELKVGPSSHGRNNKLAHVSHQLQFQTLKTDKTLILFLSSFPSGHSFVMLVLREGVKNTRLNREQ